jgi:uncharacterized protein
MSQAAAAVPVSSALGPIEARERVEIIDILRGFALFGILLVNMAFFAQPFYVMMTRDKLFTDDLSRWVEWAILFLAQGKFYTLFSFLFGLGFSVIVMRAQERGAKYTSVYLRRTFVLLLIGAAHAFLIWFGDILLLYAAVGFFLPLFRQRSPKTLVIWALALISIPVLLSAALTTAIELGRRANPKAAAEIEKGFAQQAAEFKDLQESSMVAYSSGTYAEVTRQRARDVGTIYTFSFFFAPNVLAMFVLGLYAGKRRILHDVEQHLPLLRRLQRWGLLLGLPLSFVSVVFLELSPMGSPISVEGTIAVAAGAVGAPALCFFYASSLALLAQDPRGKQRFAPLAAAGRMALTNYLMQSVICTLLFYSYGLGFYGKMHPAVGVALTVVIYAVQLPFSLWWLRRYRFGPAEWLWRSLTYGKAQPMRLSPERAGAAA